MDSKCTNYNNLSTSLKAITIVAFIYYVPTLFGYSIGCIIERITGIECPSCGITRAWIAFLRFDLEKAMYFHPLFLFPFIGVVLYSLNTFFLKKSYKFINAILIIMLIIYIGFYIVRIFYDIPGIKELDTQLNLFFLQ